MRQFFSKKLFPFSPGIPWKILNNHFVVPEINAKIWQRVLNDKDFVISCYGGLLESFFSLLYSEILLKIEPYRNVYWMGNEDQYKIVNYQGLTKIFEYNLGIETLKDYPVPIFMDAENNAYYNVLNNYLITKSFKSNKVIDTDGCISKQLLSNLMIPWDDYSIKLRKFDDYKYKSWKKESGIENNKFIVILPKSNSYHSVDCLGWDDRMISELASMVRHLGYKVISCNDSYSRSTLVVNASSKIDVVLGLIMDGAVLLSKSIDYLLISMLISDISILSRELDGIYNINENMDFLGCNNMFYSDIDLHPRDVFDFIESL